MHMSSRFDSIQSAIDNLTNLVEQFLRFHRSSTSPLRGESSNHINDYAWSPNTTKGHEGKDDIERLVAKYNNVYVTPPKLTPFHRRHLGQSPFVVPQQTRGQQSQLAKSPPVQPPIVPSQLLSPQAVIPPQVPGMPAYLDESSSTRGNNAYGSAGTLKCEQCRNRRKKVLVVRVHPLIVIVFLRHMSSRPSLPVLFRAPAAGMYQSTSS
jgi:hypothetical protein